MQRLLKSKGQFVEIWMVIFVLVPGSLVDCTVILCCYGCLPVCSVSENLICVEMLQING